MMLATEEYALCIPIGYTLYFLGIHRVFDWNTLRIQIE
jgi:hypothetical protein